MTRFLLDTHTFLWLESDRTRFDAALLERLADERSGVWFSAASVWEIAIKHSKGKLSLPSNPGTYVPDRLRRSGIRSLPIEPVHALSAGELPMHHRDPFDRILVAQAQALNLALVTADRALQQYDVDVIIVGASA